MKFPIRASLSSQKFLDNAEGNGHGSTMQWRTGTLLMFVGDWFAAGV